jgi:peptide/nickel transport system ATP-binding protein
MPSEQPILRVKGLTVDFGGRAVVQDVSLVARAGTVTAIAGGSGSGKSLTLAAIAGLLPRAARARGRVMLGELDLLALPEARLCALRGAQVGMVFQEPMTALNPLMPIGEQVAEVLRLHRSLDRASAADAAGQALDRAGLPGDAAGRARLPHELSGGQRQRALIAIATALRPALLLADEPTTALDVTTQARIMDLLGRLADEDETAVVLVSHDLALLSCHARNLVVLDAGRVVEAGRMPQVLGTFTHAAARAMVSAARPPRRQARTAAATAAPLLELRGVTRVHHLRGGSRVTALDGCDLVLRPGETLAVVGASGAGKSTLARIATGLERPDSGTLLWDGRAAPPSAELRRGVQMVFQDPASSFDPRWRIADTVAEPLHLERPRPDREGRRARAAAALARVELGPETLDRLPHAFSGGQRQRIAIARALVLPPRVVVLDEAVSALDAVLKAQILSLLDRLVRELDLACLFVTHDMGAVRALADRVMVMEAGRVVEEGPVHRILESPGHPATRALVEATPTLRLGPAGSAIVESGHVG